MTRRVDKKTGRQSSRGYEDGNGAPVADNKGPHHEQSPLTAIKRNTEKGKRRQGKTNNVQDEDYSSSPPAKKAKIGNLASQDAAFEEAPPSQDATNNRPITREGLTEIELGTPSGLMTSLVATYEVHDMKIVSSSKIQAKVTAIVETLGSFSFVAAFKPNVMLVHAKGPASSKLISIIEIAKRGIAKAGGKWYQYNFLGRTLAVQENRPVPTQCTGYPLGGKIDADSNAMEINENEDSQGFNDEEISFETMKTPLQRAIEGKPKVEAIPVLAVFLSRVRIDILKKLYGLV